MSVHILCDDKYKATEIQRLIAYNVPRATSTILKYTSPEDYFAEAVVIEVDLGSMKNLEHLQRLQQKIRSSSTRVFILRSSSRLHVAQAYALGATVVMRELVLYDLLSALSVEDRDVEIKNRDEAAAHAGASAIRSFFNSVRNKCPVDILLAEEAGNAIANSILENGLSNWISLVRRHHEGTYQHCLLVTGVAIDFGFHLGLSTKDLQRLYTSAMLHDIGKSAIPISILDKPGKLDPEERALIETHPGVGYDALKHLDGISHDVVDGVRHHHEYLDGSGYPDGLCNGSISDLVRVLTISDIFAALIERRSYKPPISRESAYAIMQKMTGKLEKPLVKAFSNVALIR